MKLRKVTIGFVMSARPVRPPTWSISTPTGPILMKFYVLSIFRKSIEKFQVSLKSDTNNGYFM